METKTKKLFIYLILPLIVCAILLRFNSKKTELDYLMHVDFYDIGQGDSFLITTYAGNQILVDGGPGDSILEKLSQDMGLFDKTIEMVILTHAHLDHFEGLIAVLNKYKVEKILMPNVEFKSEPYQAFLNAVKLEEADLIFAVQGQRIFLDNATVLDIFYPSQKEQMKPDKSADINDISIVARLTFGKTKLLLTGDAGVNIESELLKSFNLDSDLLKVGHHGSKHSTSVEFLKNVTPIYSIIQLGENNYGHPAPEVIERLQTTGTEIHRTDQNGDLEFLSDGLKIWKK